MVGNSEVSLDRFLAERWIGVDKSPSHQLSQNEIGSDNACSQHLSETVPVFRYPRQGFGEAMPLWHYA
jgi:hypothetical protein